MFTGTQVYTDRDRERGTPTGIRTQLHSDIRTHRHRDVVVERTLMIGIDLLIIKSAY